MTKSKVWSWEWMAGVGGRSPRMRWKETKRLDN